MNCVPISLKEASTRVLRGNVSVSALRSEATRGNLDTFKIGKNLYTTEEAIQEMIQKCRVQPNQPASSTEKTMTGGSSETVDATSELDALDLTVKALKSGSLPMSPKRRRTRQEAVVVPIKSQSQKS